MPDYAKNLKQRISDHLSERIGAGVSTSREYLVAEVCGWCAIPADAPVAQHVREAHDWAMPLAVNSLVGAAVRSFKAQPRLQATPEQLVLPGFVYLQKAYSIGVEDEATIVPVDALSDEQIDAKCDELQAMGDGCYAHRDELKRYKRERRRTG